MSSSVDWTTPEAYLGRVIAAPPKRGLTALAVAGLRVAFRRHRRERKRAAEHYMLRHAMRDLPDHIRRDIGLPPY